jgi:hypothetical protein
MPNIALSALLRMKSAAWHDFLAGRMISSSRSPFLSRKLKKGYISVFFFLNFIVSSIQLRWFIYLIYCFPKIFTKYITVLGLVQIQVQAGI